MSAVCCTLLSIRGQGIWITTKWDHHKVGLLRCCFRPHASLKAHKCCPKPTPPIKCGPKVCIVLHNFGVVPTCTCEKLEKITHPSCIIPHMQRIFVYKFVFWSHHTRPMFYEQGKSFTHSILSKVAQSHLRRAPNCTNIMQHMRACLLPLFTAFLYH